MSDLLDLWLDRLADRGPADLHQLHAAGDPLWNDLLTMYTPPGFALVPLDGAAVSETAAGLRVELTGRLVPTGASEVDDDTGVISRTFDTEGGWAQHHKLEIPKRFQGAGAGRAVTRESVLVYEALGIREVTLHAVDYGKYVWAMCGFDFREPEERYEVVDAIEEFAEQLGVAESFGEVEHPWEIGAATSDVPLTMRRVAEATGDEVEDSAETADLLDQEILLGKALLLFSAFEGYEGILRLGDEADPTGRDQLLVYTET